MLIYKHEKFKFLISFVSLEVFQIFYLNSLLVKQGE